MAKYNEIRAYRIRAGLTQEQMAELIGCSKNSYNKKEQGQTSITIEEASCFCKSVGITDLATMAFIFLA